MEYITLLVAEKLQPRDYVALLQCSKNIYNTIKPLLSVKKKESMIIFISYGNFTEVYYGYLNGVKEDLYMSFDSTTRIFVKYMYNNGMLTGVYKEYFSTKWKYDNIISFYLRAYLEDNNYYNNIHTSHCIIKDSEMYTNQCVKENDEYLYCNNKVTYFTLNMDNINTLQYTEDDLKYTCIYKDGTITEPVTFKTNQECEKQLMKVSRKDLLYFK